jgi:hypothetical protein
MSIGGAPASPPPPIERATLHLYQLYDVSYAIDLDAARTALATPAARARPVVSRGGSIDIPQLPLEISMGDFDLALGGATLRGHLHARIYDLGILALRFMLPLAEPHTWDEATALLAEVQTYPDDLVATFNHGQDVLRKTLAPAMERPNDTIRTEDYTILLVERLGDGASASALARHPALLQAALGERRPLSASVQSLASSLSYYEDDLMLLTWAAAIVIEPDAAARDDAALLLEFANAQLLSFRSYDAEVERDLARIARRVAPGRRPIWSRTRSSQRFLREIATLIADITDTSARVDNALKVTEDVYWNRVYSAALTTLRVEVWRSGIAEALTVLRQTAALLRDEAQEAWATLLEVLVIALIAVELVVAVLGLRGH